MKINFDNKNSLNDEVIDIISNNIQLSSWCSGNCIEIRLNDEDYLFFTRKDFQELGKMITFIAKRYKIDIDN